MLFLSFFFNISSFSMTIETEEETDNAIHSVTKVTMSSSIMKHWLDLKGLNSPEGAGNTKI